MKYRAIDHIKTANIGYFVCSSTVAMWVAAIPNLQDKFSLNSAQIGFMVLAFGIGSIIGMSLAGFLLEKIGAKFVYILSTLGCFISINLVSTMPSYSVVYYSVILLGAFIGLLEVAINIYGVYLEKRYKVFLMSMLHAFYSMGEFICTIILILMMTIKFNLQITIAIISTLIYLVSILYISKVLDIRQNKTSHKRSLVIPTKTVIYFAMIVSFTYICGGAVIDWSGVYLHNVANINLAISSIGYGLVSLAMLICRLYGSHIIKAYGPFKTAYYGAILMTMSTIGILLVNNVFFILLCFFTLGLGMANISPLCLSALSKQDKMPLMQAVSFVSIMGYFGLLCGPALLGFISYIASLKGIFIIMALLSAISSFLIYLQRRLMY